MSNSSGSIITKRLNDTVNRLNKDLQSPYFRGTLDAFKQEAIKNQEKNDNSGDSNGYLNAHASYHAVKNMKVKDIITVEKTNSSIDLKDLGKTEEMLSHLEDLMDYHPGLLPSSEKPFFSTNNAYYHDNGSRYDHDSRFGLIRQATTSLEYAIIELDDIKKAKHQTVPLSQAEKNTIAASEKKLNYYINDTNNSLRKYENSKFNKG